MERKWIYVKKNQGNKEIKKKAKCEQIERNKEAKQRRTEGKK
jgi:hypothetical protein